MVAQVYTYGGVNNKELGKSVMKISETLACSDGPHTKGIPAWSMCVQYKTG